MLAAVAKILFRLFFVIFSVVTVIFFIQRMIPGTPADAILGPDAPLVQKQEWLRQNGFDRPISQQYVEYLQGIAQGDFGRRLVDGRPIAPQLSIRLQSTAKLAVSAFAVSLCLALILGVSAAVKAGTLLDKVFALFSLLMVSAPVFMTGTLLLWLFAVRWNVLPLTGHSGFRSLILPALCLGAALAAMTSRMVRASLLDVLREDYIRTAKAKGLPALRIYLSHALRNALLPVLTVLGLQLAGLLGGAVITEQVFTWPGLGTLMLEGVNQRDYNLVSACVVVLAFIHVVISAIIDLLQRLIDPRTVTE
ncbi:MAG: hypothetical protein RLZZ488_872 [Pseudomonadota bacterium]|jgi:peptide/nickel transport system permease protein